MEPIYKWNREGTGVNKLIDGKSVGNIPISHRLWADEVEGNEIEPYKTAEELLIDESLSWEERRDELENNIILKYQGNLFYMIPRARHNMAESLEDLEETGEKLDWPVYDADTGEKKRVKVGSVEIKKFRRAIRIGINSIHVQADTQMPDNPWPLEVE